MDYLELLERSFLMRDKNSDGRLAWLSGAIFNYTTYDSGLSAEFAEFSLMMCSALNDSATYNFIESSKDHYSMYILFSNTPFFAGKMSWGTSIRGAWWEFDITLESCELYDESLNQVLEIKFTQEEWKEFVRAMIRFASSSQPTNGIAAQLCCMYSEAMPDSMDSLGDKRG